MLARSSLLGQRLQPGGPRSVAKTSSSGSQRKSGPLLVQATQERKDPAANPNYRRGSQNDYWRKRPATAKSQRGASVSVDNNKRRRGRSAHLRSPDDTPLRDGNRDRLMGMLTERAARTLEAMEAVQEDGNGDSAAAAAAAAPGAGNPAAAAAAAPGNPVLQQWLRLYLSENKIPKDGNWSDVSGENFLRQLLTKPVEEISGSFSEEDSSFLAASPVGGDPRVLAQRIMDLRHAIAKEWMEELALVQEENKLLMNEVLMKSMEASMAAAASSAASGERASAEGAKSGEGADSGAAAGQEGGGPPPKPVNIEEVDDSAVGGDD